MEQCPKRAGVPGAAAAAAAAAAADPRGRGLKTGNSLLVHEIGIHGRGFHQRVRL